ncbi:MAG: BrnT family toxin [Planctomycetes bacterium]|nr:BrnT family toxin [Planctomycetota bacterium]
MGYEWDSEKNEANREKHGIGLEEARYIFDGIVYTIDDDRSDYGELRQISIGSLDMAVVVTVVHTDRKGKIRLISARRANRKERKAYYDHIKKTLG